MKRYLYEAIFTPYEGGYEVEFPELGIFTQGATLSEAAFMAQDLLGLHISTALECGEDVPEVGQFGLDRPEGGAVMGIMAIVGAGSAELDEMTADEAADILGVSRARVYAMARDGVLESRKIGNALMISTESVKRRFNSPRGAGRPPKHAAQA